MFFGVFVNLDGIREVVMDGRCLVLFCCVGLRVIVGYGFAVGVVVVFLFLILV